MNKQARKAAAKSEATRRSKLPKVITLQDSCREGIMLMPDWLAKYLNRGPEKLLFLVSYLFTPLGYLSLLLKK